MSQPYRVIQWGTGAVGTGRLQEVLRKESLDGWEIEGRPSLRTRLDVVPSLAEGAGADYDPGVSGTAGTVINAIPAVVAADAGILRTSVIR